MAIGTGKRGVSMRVSGEQALSRRYKKLAGPGIRKILRTAVTKACRPVVRAGKRNAPRDSGFLRKNIIQVVRTYKKAVVGVVGPKAGVRGQVPRSMWAVEGNTKGRLIRKTRMVTAIPALYAHLVEKGTRAHAIGAKSSMRLASGARQSGAIHPGTKGTHFMQRAWSSTRGEVQQIIQREMKAGLQQETAAYQQGAIK